MKRTVLFAAAALAFGGAMANPVTVDRAAGMAHELWTSLGGKAGVSLNNIGWAYNDVYLFAADGGGFVMVAADDCAQPLLGYSLSSAIDPQNLPIQLQEWIEGYQRQIERCREVGDIVHPGWMAEGGMPSVKGVGDLEDVEPLTTTLWDQEYPYNQMCPNGTVTGCAATAQAQLMKYWNYPAFGQGRHSYNHQTYGAQTADFAHTIYRWDLMNNTMGYSSTAAEREAVATLMYHVGVSLDMQYANAMQGGSAAAGLAGVPGYASIDNSLKDYFNYNPDMTVISKTAQWTDERWADTLATELQFGRPIVYQGQSSLGGHGFICDGCEWRTGTSVGDRWYFHFNFGWSGQSNGYYPVGAITPPYGGAGSAGLDFSEQNKALLRCMPNYAARVSDTIFSFNLEGGRDSVIFGISEIDTSTWSISVDQPWVTLGSVNFTRAGWVSFDVAENNTGATRVAYITLTQGTSTVSTRVVQAHFSADDLCPLKVVMQSTDHQGWQGGAYLSFESVDGYLFGTAAMTSAVAEQTAYVNVGDHDVYVVFHHGGSTDRKINYSVYNNYDEELVSVTYAYLNGGTHLVPWPCVHVSVDEVETAELSVYPNPAASRVNVCAEGLRSVQLMDLAGRTVMSLRADTDRQSFDVSALASGTYIVRAVTADGVVSRRIVKE